jgi:hypothetical protein
MMPPQPSGAGPTWRFSDAHVAGTHVVTHALHCPDTPPAPQTSPAGHVPQSRKVEHPSYTEPQARPSPAHVAGTQVFPQSPE